MVNKIAYIVGDFPPRSETWVRHEILQLIQGGFDIKIFSFREKRPSFFLEEYSELVKNTVYRDKFFLIHFAENIATNLRIFFRIFKEIGKDFWSDTRGLRGKLQVLKDLILFINKIDEINSFNPNLVIVHFANHRANAALYNNILNKTPYIIKMHATDVFRRPNLFHLKVKTAYKILIISNYNINFINNRDKDIDTSKFIIHRCGIPTNKYEVKPVSNKNNKIPVILSVGKLTPMKGFDTLINSSSILHNKGFEHKLIIVGHGSSYKKFLADLAADLGIQDFVEFKGYCSPEEVKNLLYFTDLFVLASRTEGMPVAIMEAMSTGLPVIATKISGIPELIENGINGFLVDPDDPVSLSAKIEEVLSMPKNQLDEIGKKARSKIESDFDIAKLTDELKNLFELEN